MPSKKVAKKIDFDKVKAEVGFEVVIKELESQGFTLRGSGDEQKGVCPIPSHGGDRTAEKFSINVGKKPQVFKCHLCGKGGNVLDFADALRSKGLKDAATWLWKLQFGEDAAPPLKEEGGVERREGGEATRGQEREHEGVAFVYEMKEDGAERADAAEGERDTVFEDFVQIMEAAAQRACLNLIEQYRGDEYGLSCALAKFFVGLKDD